MKGETSVKDLAELERCERDVEVMKTGDNVLTRGERRERV